MQTSSEQARHARAELESIVAALRVHELAQLVALGRKILEQPGDGPGQDAFDRRRRGELL